MLSIEVLIFFFWSSSLNADYEYILCVGVEYEKEGQYISQYNHQQTDNQSEQKAKFMQMT